MRATAPRSERGIWRLRSALFLLLASGMAASAWGDTGESPEPLDAASWRAFAPEEGRFRALFPSAPRITTSLRQTFVGPIHESRYASAADGTQFAVELRDLPALAGFFLSAEGILSRASAGLLEASGGRLIDSDAAPLGVFPARRLRYVLPGDPARTEQARLVLVGDRLYIAFATWRADAPADAEVPRFFEAFLVWSR
jgi:hypothetical protein